MSRPVGLSLNAVSAARAVTGAPVAADSGTLTDANFSPTPDNTTGGAINAFGFATVLLNIETAGGSSPTAAIDLLFRDGDAADGSRWKRIAGAVKPVLDGAGWVEVQTYGRLVYPRIDAVVGSPTSVTILAMPGQRLPGRAFY